MPTDTLSIYMDTAESRVKRERLVTLVDGRHWDILESTAFIESISRTGMLTPLYFTPEWQTTATGDYKRLGKGDYTFYQVADTFPGPAGTPSAWVEHHVPIQGNIYLYSQNVNEVALTNASYPKNRPFLLSWFSYNAGQGSFIQAECGWMNMDYTESVSLRFWSDGKVDIYKNQEQIGQGNIFERKVTSQTIYGKESLTTRTNKVGRGDARQLAQQFVDVAMIPFKRRQMLFLCNQGGGFVFTFKDIDENDPDPTITPAGQFFWYVPTGKPTVLCAPLNFTPSKILLSDLRHLREAPGVGEEPTIQSYWDEPGYGTGMVEGSLVEADGTTPFVPDGEKTEVRVKIALTGDGTSTAFVYGASGIFDALLADTDTSETSLLDDYVLKASLSVPESPTDVRMQITLKAPEEIESLQAPQIRTVSNRPVEAYIGSIAFLTGRSQSPQWLEGVDDVARELMAEFRDRCVALDDYRFLDGLPYDGIELSEALGSIVKLPGYSDADLDIEYFGFLLPTIGQQSQGEFVLLPRVGDKALDWIDKLWKTYARHTLWGWVPTIDGPQFRMNSLDSLDAAASQGTLFFSTTDALDNGVDPDFLNRFVIRRYKEDVIKCEANDIWVTGRNPRTGKPIQAHYADRSSQDPTLFPSERPSNWVGEPRRYGWVDPAITTQAAANWVCATLARRLTPARLLVEFDVDLQIRSDGAPLWRGQKITLDGVGDARVMTLSTDFEIESAAQFLGQKDFIWRPTKYTGEIPL